MAPVNAVQKIESLPGGELSAATCQAARYVNSYAVPSRVDVFSSARPRRRGDPSIMWGNLRDRGTCVRANKFSSPLGLV